MRYSLNYAHLPLLVVLLLAAGCGSTPLDSNEPAPVPSWAVVINLSQELSPATTARVSQYLSLGGSVAAKTDARLDILPGGHSAVFAIDATGTPLLGAMILPGTTAEIGARSSALLAVRLVAPPDAVVPGEAADLERRIALLPGFQTLVDSVNARASRGISLTGHIPTLEEAHSLARGLTDTDRSRLMASQVSTSGAPQFSVAEFTTFTAVTALGAPERKVNLSNGMFAPLRVSVPEGDIRLARREICYTCWPWNIIAPETGDFKVARDGPLEITVALDRDVVIAQTLFDLVGIAFGKLSDMPIDKSVAANLAFFKINTSISVLEQLTSGKPVDEIGPILLKWLVDNAETIADIFVSLYPRLSKSAITEKLIHALPGIGTAVGLINLTTAALSFGTAFKYWSERETANWCIEDERLYGGCSHSVEITPSEMTLAFNERALLTATVFDADGRVLKDKKAGWTSSRPDILNVPADPAVVVEARALDKPGIIMITATSAGKDRTALVTVSGGPCAQTTYTLFGIDTHPDIPPGYIGVDDDFFVYVDGTQVFADTQWGAQSHPPITFEAGVGCNLRVRAIDRYSGGTYLSPFALRNESTGAEQVLEEKGVHIVGGSARGWFYDRTFVIEI
jgi:hypothetical protein